LLYDIAHQIGIACQQVITSPLEQIAREEIRAAFFCQTRR
jgi:hypothetical protein